MKKMCTLLFAALFATTAWSNEKNLSGVVTAVLSGNTLEVRSDEDETIKVKLHGIESPELGQAYGEEAKKFLEKKLLKKCVTVTVLGRDRKGVPLAVVVDIRKQVDPRIELLKNGLAWTSEKDPLPDLEQHRTLAEKKGIGLWKEKEPTPPWVYRRQQSMATAKSS